MTWLVEAVPDAATFLDRIAPWRWRDPRGAHAVVGMALGEVGRPGSTIEWFVIGESDGRAIGALMHDPWPVYLPAMPVGAARALARFLIERSTVTDDGVSGRVVRGVNGATAATEAFVEEWVRLGGAPFRVHTRVGVLELGELAAGDAPPGTVRPATEDDLPLLDDWYATFDAEALPHMPPTPAAKVRGHVASRRMLLRLDAAGRPVALAGGTPVVDGVATVTRVFTPAGERGRGYAASVIAAVVRACRADGAEHVRIVADLANPTSCGLYHRLGFRQVAEEAEWVLAGP